VNFTPPPADSLRAAVMGVAILFMPLMDAMGWMNLDDAQMAIWETFITAVVTLGMLFYNPQRDS